MEPDVQEEERGFFAATNGSPNSTAVALSLQVCVVAATGTPRTQELISLQALKSNRKCTRVSQIKKPEYLKNIYRGNSPHLGWLTITQPNTRMYIHGIMEKHVHLASRSNRRAMWPSCSYKKHTQRHPFKNPACCLFSNVSLLQNNELETTQFSNHLLLKVHFLTSSFSYLYTHRHTYHIIFSRPLWYGSDS